MGRFWQKPTHGDLKVCAMVIGSVWMVWSLSYTNQRDNTNVDILPISLSSMNQDKSIQTINPSKHSPVGNAKPQRGTENTKIENTVNSKVDITSKTRIDKKKAKINSTNKTRIDNSVIDKAAKRKIDSYNSSITLWKLGIPEISKDGVGGSSIMNYLPNYKSPCWFDKQTGVEGIQCLPYVYLAGVSKASTTSLYGRLLQHPDIIRPRVKEIFWWTWNFPGGQNPMDGTSGYFTDQAGHLHAPGNMVSGEPRYTLAHTLYTLNPHTRIIVSLREPTERVYSHYHFMRAWKRHTWSAADFHECVVWSMDRMKECLKHHTLRSCAFNTTVNVPGNHGSLNSSNWKNVWLYYSMYYVYTKEWLSVFPKNQILFIKSEEFIAHPVTVLRDAFDFLGLDMYEVDSLFNSTKTKMDVENKKVDAKHHKDGYSVGMLESTRKLLDEFFKPHNRRLADLLGDKKWLFKAKESDGTAL